jgi:hypothetical protein
MPRSKEGFKRPKVSEENLGKAIEAVKNGTSIRMAAKQFQLSRVTLQRHFQSHLNSGNETFTYINNCNVWKVFNCEEEKQLVKYLLTASQMHYGLSKNDVLGLAYQFAKANAKKYPTAWDINCQAGEQWFTDFRKRNCELSLRKPRATSIARSSAFNKPIVNQFFDKLENVLQKHGFTADNIYNVDESGISTVHTPPKVIAGKGTKQVGCVTSSERGYNVTIIGCVNAFGNSVPPVLIFPRVNFKNHMLHGAPPLSYGTCNPSGWSTAEIFVEFLEHFIKLVKPSKDRKVLLILDNHESHITIDAINKARDNGIVMLTIPPHTSHKLQPLDVTVFGPFKKYYNIACKNWLSTNPGKLVSQ